MLTVTDAQQYAMFVQLIHEVAGVFQGVDDEDIYHITVGMYYERYRHTPNYVMELWRTKDGALRRRLFAASLF